MHGMGKEHSPTNDNKWYRPEKEKEKFAFKIEIIMMIFGGRRTHDRPRKLLFFFCFEFFFANSDQVKCIECVWFECFMLTSIMTDYHDHDGSVELVCCVLYW